MALDAAAGWSLDVGPVAAAVRPDIALKAAPVILARHRAVADANLALLAAFLGRHDALFSWRPPEGGMVGYPRYHGAEGVEAFVTRMAETAGVLLLPARVFRSDLLTLPDDRFRIGFGQHGFAAGLAALEAALA